MTGLSCLFFPGIPKAAKYFTVGYYYGMSDSWRNIQTDFLESFLFVEFRFQEQLLQKKKKSNFMQTVD